VTKARLGFAAVGGVAGLAFLIVAASPRRLSAAEPAVSVVISKDGIKPDRIPARKGETLRLSVTTADEEHCFAIDELRVEKRVLPKKATSVELTPDRAGTFKVYCCLEPAATAPHAQLVVVE
jgi:heme/copper-type cytochrome/quinol oxidase subunit 2